MRAGSWPQGVNLGHFSGRVSVSSVNELRRRNALWKLTVLWKNQRTVFPQILEPSVHTFHNAGCCWSFEHNISCTPSFRFYALYDKVYRKDVLAFAYECCKANGGAAGVDGQRFEDIEAYGVERWLHELAQELKSRTYQPLPVRRVYIPKPDGKQQ